MDTILTWIHENLSVIVIVVPLLALVTIITIVEYLMSDPISQDEYDEMISADPNVGKEE